MTQSNSISCGVLNEYSGSTDMYHFCTTIAGLQVPVFIALGFILLGGVLSACSWYFNRTAKNFGARCGVSCLAICAILLALVSFAAILITSILFGVLTDAASYNHNPGATCTVTSLGASLNALYVR